MIGQPEYYEFSAISTGNFGEYDGNLSNGYEYELELHNVSSSQNLVFTTNASYRWSDTGPGPKEPPMPELARPVDDRSIAMPEGLVAAP